MAEIKSFSDLLVWQKAHKLFLEIVKFVESLPKNRAGMVISDQILRSASSISANIAEGYGRRGKDYIYKQVMGQCAEVIRMINGLLSSLRKQRNKT